MAARPHFSPAALDDLDAVERFIEQDSPMGVARPDLGEGLRLFGIRRRVAIIYGPNEDRISLVRILYGGRDLRALFRAEAE